MLVKKLKIDRDAKKKKTGKCEGRKSYSEMDSDIINHIKKLRRKPKGKKRATFTNIAETLNQQGYKNANGRPFSGNAVQNILYRLKK